MATPSLSSTDVAREAGVSRATVSYVLNDRRDVRVSDATRQHVLDVARRLGYVASPAARALRSGRGEVVLLLIPAWEVAGQLELLLEEIGQLVAQQGLVCLRYEGPQWQGSLDRLLAQIPVACVVTFDPLPERDAQTVAATRTAEVRAWLLDHPGQPHTTVIDQGAVVEAQVDHLLQRGYRRLAYLALHEPRGQAFTQARTSAFVDLCRVRGLEEAPTATVAADVDAVIPVLRSLTASVSEPLGLATWNDLTALAVLSAAAACGLQVPHDLGVIGGDDTAMASLTRPPLSSVRFNLTSEAEGIAARIAAVVGHQSEQAPSAAEGVHVVARESTANPGS